MEEFLNKINRQKLTQTLVITVVALAILLFLLNIIIQKDKTVEEKIGTSNLMNISTEEYTYVKGLSLDIYFKHLENNDIEKAYNMLSKEYKEYKPYESYIEDISKINLENITIKDIKRKGEYSFVANIDVNGIEKKYLIYKDELNDKVFKISPDSFINFYLSSFDFKMSGLYFKVNNYLIEIDRIVASVKIENKTNKDTIEIAEINAITNKGKSSGLDKKIILKPGENLDTYIIFNVKYEFLDGMQVIRNFINKGEIKIYTFDL